MHEAYPCQLKTVKISLAVSIYRFSVNIRNIIAAKFVHVSGFCCMTKMWEIAQVVGDFSGLIKSVFCPYFVFNFFFFILYSIQHTVQHTGKGEGELNRLTEYSGELWQKWLIYHNYSKSTTITHPGGQIKATLHKKACLIYLQLNLVI